MNKETAYALMTRYITRIINFTLDKKIIEKEIGGFYVGKYAFIMNLDSGNFGYLRRLRNKHSKHCTTFLAFEHNGYLIDVLELEILPDGKMWIKDRLSENTFVSCLISDTNEKEQHRFVELAAESLMSFVGRCNSSS